MTDIIMPALSPTMTEGAIIAWHKQPGEAVHTGDLLLEIETDKTVIEVEASASGLLGEHRYPAGAQGVPVGACLAVLHAESVGASADAKPVESSEAERRETRPASAAPSSAAEAERRPASPLARRLAKENGLSLAQIPGTGPGGRIVEADVLRAAGRSAQTAAPAFKTVPHRPMRRAIAERLTQSAQTIPQFQLSMDCELDALLLLKATLNTEGHPFTLNDFLIKACAHALVQVPAANASWTDEAMLLHANADIAVAVAVPNGLVTPIIAKAQDKSLHHIAEEMRQLASLARQGRLVPAQYQGGTFSLSNLGTWGVRSFTALVNPPQACILAVGAARQQAVVRQGAIVPAQLMTCTLSADHRVIDGAQAAAFLSAVRQALEAPDALLL
ncbi:MAG: 2-oxo acid dehydrogenase subunit E2 [Pigmentiphaga sp.]|nr:2-oxo acid dehydrogenase subunit E2 [Pigmentiphaga sp.]